MSLGTSAVGTVLSAGGAYSAAQSQRSSLEYQASVARSNAALVQSQASDALRAGQTSEEAQDLRTGQIMGQQRAALSASGVDLGSGNASDVLSTTSLMGQRDAMQIHQNAMLQAWGYNTQAQNYLDDASRESDAASSISPFMAGTTSLLTGATGAARTWDQQAKATGMPSASQAISTGWSKLWG